MASNRRQNGATTDDALLDATNDPASDRNGREE